MFCGWQLYNDYKHLLKLAEGDLQINVLNKDCFFNGKLVKPFFISEILHEWLLADLQTNNINLNSVNEASLNVKFTVKKNPKSRKGIVYIDHDFLCKSKIKSGNDIYIVHFQDTAGVQKIIQKAT
jgi:hypothetical protein